jgi:hypothetical protein
MAKGQGKKGLIVTIVVLGLTLLAVGGFLVWQNATKPTAPAAPAVSTSTPSTSTSAATTTNTTATTTPAASSTPTVDPSTLTSIDITQLSITVYYTKGVGGFDYVISRTANGTQYVTFSNADLVGTKCTNDQGDFASIIKNPTSAEDNATISQKVEVGSDTYGLSLAADNCTSNPDLLAKYQTAFTNGFSQLKAL